MTKLQHAAIAVAALAAFSLGAGAPAQAPAAPTPQAPAAPAQVSVASIAAQLGIPAQVAANMAAALKVAPGAPLTPEQAERAQRIIQNYVQRNAPQAAAGGQGGPSQGGGPGIPQIKLPWGLKDPQEAIVRLDQEAARLASSPNPYNRAQVPYIEDYRNRIAAQSDPKWISQNERLVDPRTGQTLIQGQNPATVRMQAMQGKADDIADAIKSGDQPPVLTGRSQQDTDDLTPVVLTHRVIVADSPQVRHRRPQENGDDSHQEPWIVPKPPQCLDQICRHKPD